MNHDIIANGDAITCSCGQWAADLNNEAGTINRSYQLHVAAAFKAEVVEAQPEPAEDPKPEPADLRELSFELVAARRGLIMTYGKLEEHQGRLADLPKQPDNFRPMIGTYAAVSREANRRNEAQINHKFLDYLYSPEPRKLEGASK